MPKLRITYILLLLLMVTAGSGGCSWLVICSGKNLNEVNKDQARSAFGPPIASGVLEGQPFDDFRTHRKIDEVRREQEPSIDMLCTLGMSELWHFPHELCRATWLCLKGRHIRYVYDADGNVTALFLDGEPIRSGLLPERPASAPNGAKPSPGINESNP